MATKTITQPLLNSIPDELASRFDPVYVEYYNKYNVGRLATHQVDIREYRANPLKYTILYGRADGGEVFRVTEQKCAVKDGEINVRIFEPGPMSVDEPLRPAYVNYHGGGWTFGSLAMDDPYCRMICREVGAVCFDIEYRLAPEHPFPTPVEDAWTALQWVFETKAQEFHVDVKRIAIGGVSAGGHLSAVMGHMARDAGLPLAFQILSVPGVDLNTVLPNGEIRPDNPWKSYRELEHTAALPVPRITYVLNHFLGNPRQKGVEEDWRVSPLHSPNFKNLAPALVITAELDPLRDEGAAYAEKLKSNGNKVEHIMFKGVPHPFMQLDAILDAGKQYNVETIRALKAALY
ncbi:hypothetical protein B0A52_03303 [Exophiala mesophila]|uniref:Alpha/beta hydrolase fold-3 domain-containing protein n=1 Tax=Exophiala mesophila TaxID=212818 RepID=A0A438NBH4_EXOME|nr:hypothetical protein B0A52_03303 [Exophiala mesophila]